MGRPVGNNIKNIVRILERAKGEPLSIAEILKRCPNNMLPPASAATMNERHHQRSAYLRVYTRRAEALGILRVASKDPLRWILAAGYESKVERTRSQVAHSYGKAKPTAPNSVFNQVK